MTGSTAGIRSDEVLVAAQAHLWFVTIHPFDDGNGRIARAIADMALARSEQSAKRFYSMSAQIQLERNEYYDILERTQKGGVDVTPWMEWFLGCLERALRWRGDHTGKRARKARFWEAHAGESFNDRQRTVLERLAGRVRGEADVVEMGQADQVLAGYGRGTMSRIWSGHGVVTAKTRRAGEVRAIR